jgi:hypothetical protein
MTPLSRCVVLFTILMLPSRLFGQVTETSQQAPLPQPAHTPTAPPPGGEVCVDDINSGRSWWDAMCGREDRPARYPFCQSVFIFGGSLTKGSMGDTADVFNVTYDGNHIIGLGYQRFPWTSRNFYLGWEVGVAGRSGNGDTTAEIWGGAAVRHHGFTIADRVIITPSLTAGFSVVSHSMGHEAYREYRREGDATFLFYLGPEISLSTTARPNLELFYRLHHRCGGNRTLGGLSEGYNANVLGLRLKF